MQPAVAPEDHPHVVRRRPSLMLLPAVLCVLGEILLWALAHRKVAPPPSLVMLALGIGAMFFGAWTIYRVNNSAGRLSGRVLGLWAIVAGVIATPLFSFQFAAWEKRMEKREELNMHSVAVACVEYAIHNHYHFPPSLAVLLLQHTITPKMLSNPLHGTAPFSIPAGLPVQQWRKIAPMVSEASDYQYIGADLTKPLSVGQKPLAGQIMLLYRNEQDFQSAGPIAFANGSVRWVKQPQMMQVVRQSNAARKQLGLPVVTFFTNAPVAPGAPAKTPAPAPAK